MPLTFYVCFFLLLGVGQGRPEVLDLQYSVENDYSWGCEDYDETTSSSLLDYLWCTNVDLAEAAYQTGFIQGVRNGTLNPVDYAKFALQDCWWSNEGAQLFGTLCSVKNCTEQIADFFRLESAEYAAWVTAYTTDYVMKVDSAIPVAESRDYYQFEEDTVDNYDPEYAVVVITPCLQLWPMLSQRLQAEGAMTSTSLYSDWISYNIPLFEDVGRSRAILDSDDSIDWTLARSIYRQAMQMEVNFFTWATSSAQ